MGAVAAPRFPAGPGHRRDQGRQPARGRHHPRRPRHHRLGRHQRGSRSQLAVDHRAGRAVHQGPRPDRTVRPEAARLRRPPGDRAPCEGRRPGARDPRTGLHGQAAAGALQRRRRRPGVPRSRRAPAPRRPGHVLPGPLPAHQGQAAGPGPARRRLDRGLRGPAQGTPRRLPRGLPGLLRPARDSGQPRAARRGPGDRPGPRGGHVLLRGEQADRPGGGGVLPQRHQRHARRRGRLQLRADRGIREVPDRILGPGRGQAGPDAQAEIPRRPDRPGDRGGVGHRQGDRHPLRRRRARAWSSPT